MYFQCIQLLLLASSSTPVAAVQRPHFVTPPLASTAIVIGSSGSTYVPEGSGLVASMEQVAQVPAAGPPVAAAAAAPVAPAAPAAAPLAAATAPAAPVAPVAPAAPAAPVAPAAPAAPVAPAAPAAPAVPAATAAAAAATPPAPPVAAAAAAAPVAPVVAAAAAPNATAVPASDSGGGSGIGNLFLCLTLFGVIAAACALILRLRQKKPGDAEGRLKEAGGTADSGDSQFWKSAKSRQSYRKSAMHGSNMLSDSDPDAKLDSAPLYKQAASEPAVPSVVVTAPSGASPTSASSTAPSSASRVGGGSYRDRRSRVGTPAATPAETPANPIDKDSDKSDNKSAPGAGRMQGQTGSAGRGASRMQARRADSNVEASKSDDASV